MGALLAAVFAASLAGSLHCAGMCGGLVAFFAGADVTGRARRIAHVAYHAGRLATYVALGGLAGSVGAALDLAGDAAGLAHVAGLTAGVLMVAWGAQQLIGHAGVRLPRGPRFTGVSRAAAHVLARARERPPALRALALGLATTLLPCGWLHAFTLTAAGSGTAWRGAAVMAAFWAGSVPALAGVGVLAHSLARPLRARLPVLTAALVVAVGALTLLGRLPVPTGRAMAAPAPPAVCGAPAH